MHEKKHEKAAARAKPPQPDSSAEAADGNALPAEELRMAALAMSELATSLHELVSFLRMNPQITELPEAMRELSKRISVLSTRL